MKNKPINIKSELENQMEPWIEYLVQNRNDHNKLNSCLDVASDNIRSLESLISAAESYLKSFKMLKKIVIYNEEKYQKANPTIKTSETEKTLIDD